MSNTINPNQIRPFPTDGELVGTTGGVTAGLQIVGGPGITVTRAGNEIIISTTSVPLEITSYTGYQLVEVGTAIVNPAFTLAYAGTPISASISNTDGISSPWILASPFTSATITGTFAHSSAATVPFTVTASDGNFTRTQNQTLNWANAIFGGVGAAGATPTVTASGTTAVLSTGDILPRIQLGIEGIGQPLGPFSPSAQKIYLLLVNPGHTFVDAGTGAPFPMNGPISVSFVNVNGVTVSMYLYESTYTQSLPFTLKVAT